MARTLNNFGVPTDSGSAVGTGILQPKLNYRFRVVVAGFGGIGTSSQEFTRQVMNVSRPKVSHESIPLRDDIANNLTKLVGRQVQSQLDHRNQRGPSAGTNYKFSTLIEILDGNSGDATEQWQLEGCFITNADYSQTDYAVSDPVTITVTLQYDNAVLNDDIMPPMDFISDSTVAG